MNNEDSENLNTQFVKSRTISMEELQVNIKRDIEIPGIRDEETP